MLRFPAHELHAAKAVVRLAKGAWCVIARSHRHRCLDPAESKSTSVAARPDTSGLGTRAQLCNQTDDNDRVPRSLTVEQRSCRPAVWMQM